MTIEFDFKVTRYTFDEEEYQIELEIVCDVTQSWEEEGRSYFVSVLSCTDDNGNDVSLTWREQQEVENIAVDRYLGDY
jgi:hypothetical protein